MPFTSAPARANDLYAIPRVDTHSLQLDDFLNPAADLYGFGRADLDMVMGMELNYQTFADYTELTGKVQSIKSLEYFDFETGLLFRSVKIASIVASSTPASVTFTLAADSYSEVGSIYGADVNRSPLMENSVLLCSNEINGLVISKNTTESGLTTQYTAIRREGTSDDLLAALTFHLNNNVRLASYTNAFAEGSKSPLEGRDMPTTRLVNQMQTFRDKDEITGDVDSLGMSIPWQGKTLYFDKVKLLQQWAHRIQVNRAMFLSPGGNFRIPGNTPGKGRVRLTTGLLPGVQQVGSTYEFDDEIGFMGGDIDAIVARGKANHSGSSYIIPSGYKFHAGFQKGIKELIGGGIAAIDYSNFGGANAKEKAVQLGFNSLGYGGMSFHLQESEIFNEPEVTALDGYKYSSMGLFIPGGMQKVTENDNGITQQLMVPTLRLLHTTGSDGEARRYFTFKRGIQQDGIDQKVCETLTQQGLSVVNLRNFMLAKGD